MFYFIRHGERADQCCPDIQQKLKTPADTHLTETGLKQAETTGIALRESIKKLIADGIVDSNPEIILCSSTLFRCFQTCKSILKNLDMPIKDNTIHVEVAIEELFNPHCRGCDEHYRENIRFYNQENYPELGEEIFNDVDQKHNTIFNYEERPKLIAQWIESWTDADVRFREVLDNIGEMYSSGKYDKRKQIFVFVSHGISIQCIFFHLEGVRSHFSFCSLNLFEVGDEKEDNHYKITPHIRNQLSWENN